MEIVIADRHTLTRKGLKDLIAARYAEARFTELCQLREVDALLGSSAPQLMILDLLLEDGNPLTRISTWRREHPETAILVYSMLPSHLYAERLMAMGASAFMRKDAPEQEVLQAIVGILTVGARPNPVRHNGHDANGHGAPGASPFHHLSDQELVVMQDLLDDHGIKEISQRMQLSPSTVATYKARLFSKLGVHSMADLQRLIELHQITS